jgi:hypothetical protein
MGDEGIQRSSRFTWAWVGVGILIIGVLAWLVYGFLAMAEEPDPVPVRIEQPSPIQ